MTRYSFLAVALLGLLCMAAGTTIKTFSFLRPPSPMPEGISRTAHGRASMLVDPGVQQRFKLDVEDVTVIANGADPEFCNGFYEAVLTTRHPITGLEREVSLPGFAGFIATCVVPGDPHGQTAGELDYTVALDQSDLSFDPDGMTLRIWEVLPVRDRETGAAVPGFQGEAFQIRSRLRVALEGILQLSPAP